MKYCVINSIYPPVGRGGAEVVAERVVAGLIHEGHDVVLITLGRAAAVDRTGHLTTYHLTSPNVFSFLDINRYYPAWVRALWHIVDTFNLVTYIRVRRLLRRERPDAVLTHNLKGIGYLIPAAIRSLGIRHLHTVHDVQLSRPSGLILVGQEKPFLLLDKVYERICRWLFGSPTVVISPSAWLLEYYRRRGFFRRSHGVVQPNPVIFQHPHVRPNAEQFSGVTLLYVGQLERAKGVMLLIETCKKLHGNWRLLIAGSGSLDAEVNAAVTSDERFVRLGWIEPAKLANVYAQADCTVVPSLCYENSPTVISESLVASVPVIAADIGGIAELVTDGVNGFTFAPGNGENLKDVLQHFIDHPERFAQLRQHCFPSVREYSIDRYLRQLLTLADTQKS